MLLTGDGHVHSEWSRDTGGPRSAAAGRMEAMCRRARHTRPSDPYVAGFGHARYVGLRLKHVALPA